MSAGQLVPPAFLLLAAAHFLLAAKAHGRQVRLERELVGYWEVTFGGENPPFVEALWRRDRRQWWATYPAALVAGLALVSVSLPSSGGFLGLADPSTATLVAVGAVAALWAPVTAFLVAVLSSYRRFLGALRDPTLRSRAEPKWLASSLLGSRVLWTAVAVPWIPAIVVAAL